MYVGYYGALFAKRDYPNVHSVLSKDNELHNWHIASMRGYYEIMP